MKVAIYSRYSTDNQDVSSIAGQVANCEALAARESLDVVGRYDHNHFPEFGEYMNDVVDTLDGFLETPYDITWYARKKDESDIVEAMKQAVREGNDTIIIEYLD